MKEVEGPACCYITMPPNRHNPLCARQEITTLTYRLGVRVSEESKQLSVSFEELEELKTYSVLLFEVAHRLGLRDANLHSKKLKDSSQGVVIEFKRLLEKRNK